MNGIEEHIRIYGEVKDAIENNIPVVALESTFISHGMPYPENLDTAVAVGSIIRNCGAIPATVAIINGKIKIGISFDELEMLSKNKAVIKTSTRDIHYVMVKGLNGATTVAATMFIASLAKIKVFATGGIGGVYGKATLNMDISNDLAQLSKSNLSVVCSGVKPALDTGLTLEALETLGVPVAGYRTSNFPGFYLKKSGYRVSCRYDSISEMARSIKLKWDMGLNGGVIIANPIPDMYELDEAMISDAVNKAIEDSELKQIRGKELTPYLLSVINEITDGKSLKANIELFKNNAKLAAELSIELEKLYQSKLPFDNRVLL